MSLEYKVYIQEEQPPFDRAILLWVKPSISVAYLRQGYWVSIAGGSPITSFTAGVDEMVIYNQATAPAEAVGQIWINSTTKESFIFLDDWYSFAGA